MIDVVGKKIYWADNFTKKIQRANLDGSVVQDIFVVPSGVHSLGGVAIDVASGHVYWTDAESGASGTIFRRNMDRTGIVESVISSNNHGPTWVDIDTSTGNVYWSAVSTNTVLRNNTVIASGINNVQDIALDVKGRKIYWASLTDDKIVRANLDGSNQIDAVTGLGDPHGLAFIIPEPSAIVLAAIGMFCLFTYARLRCNMRLIALIIVVLAVLGHSNEMALAEIVAPGFNVNLYANVSDPIQMTFDPTGTLYVGRDNSGSGGTGSDAVRIHRIGIGGSPVVEYGIDPIPDPDAVAFDATGAISGTPGSVLVGGNISASSA